MSNKDSSPQEENFNPEQAKSFRDNYVVSEKAKGREIKKKPTGHGKDLIKGYVIPKNDILNLLKHDNVAGIRAYHGLNQDGGKELILYPFDEDGNDIDNIVWAPIKKCPPYCYRITIRDDEISND